MTLKTTLLELCRYSFEHMRLYDFGSATATALRCVAIDMLAHQIACFLANNTVEGNNRVDTGVLAPGLERAYTGQMELEDFVDFLIRECGG
jgi:hypothetical protein